MGGEGNGLRITKKRADRGNCQTNNHRLLPPPYNTSLSSAPPELKPILSNVITIRFDSEQPGWSDSHQPKATLGNGDCHFLHPRRGDCSPWGCGQRTLARKRTRGNGRHPAPAPCNPRMRPRCNPPGSKPAQ